MEDNTYNGWTNHATWIANLWVTNEPYLSESISNGILDLASSEMSFYDAGKLIKEQLEAHAELQHPTLFEDGSFALDMFNGYMSDVNWDEIAQNWIDEIPELYVDGDLAGGKRIYTREDTEA
jgi:hypothetical protein